ncbi:hypothetical protein [Brevibacillus sp. NRS-1366]|uniref:hypothetical protein n=1 Tax=Brevibacillus sp. NRS-1366 TaxID=3233899 RepID=UPI003D1F77F5
MNQFNGFNFSNSRFQQENHTDIGEENIQINLQDAEDIVAEFFGVIKNAKSEEELYTLLLEFYDEVADNEIKHYIHEDITRKMGDLHQIEYPDDTPECDCGHCNYE